jgi:hypothetical protein
MPFSWIRIPNHYSPKISEYMEEDTKAAFVRAVERIVGEDGGELLGHVYFEVNGRWAHAHVSWDTKEQRRDIVFDLEAEQAVDLLTLDELGSLSDQRRKAD